MDKKDNCLKCFFNHSTTLSNKTSLLHFCIQVVQTSQQCILILILFRTYKAVFLFQFQEPIQVRYIILSSYFKLIVSSNE